MDVVLRYADIDRHGAGCDCGTCDSNGKSIGVGIYHVGAEIDAEPIDCIFGPSESSTFETAQAHAEMLGYTVVEDREEV